MVVSQDDMTDSEIIQLLGEYEFTNKEMSDVLRDIKKRDFESVLAYIEEVRKDKGTWQDNDKEKMLDELRKRNDNQKVEEERMERYRKLLVEKIAANRVEQRIREEKENEAIPVSEKPIQIDGDVKVRILVADGEEMYVGFDMDATLKDLYEKVAERIGRTSFELSLFGIGTPVPVSSRLIADEFKAKAVMLEIS